MSYIDVFLVSKHLPQGRCLWTLCSPSQPHIAHLRVWLSPRLALGSEHVMSQNGNLRFCKSWWNLKSKRTELSKLTLI